LGGVRRQKLTHHALEIRRQVLDDHESERTRELRLLEQTLQRFQPAGRSADAGHELGPARRRLSGNGGFAHDSSDSDRRPRKDKAGRR
jgi:hypothetical protein